MTSIGINEFVRRQTKESEFTHFVHGWSQLVAITLSCMDDAKPGYRDGVLVVPLKPEFVEGFFTGIVTLQEGDKLVGEYKARVPGEEPRKTLRVSRLNHVNDGENGVRSKSPCKHVDIILYHKDVLAENKEQSTDCDWEIVSINGRITDEEAPIHPDTLIANHFQLDGGTATGMSPEEFEKALKESVLYWKNKAMLVGD